VLGNVIQLLQCFVLIDFVYKELFLLCSIISVLLHVKCEFLCSFANANALCIVEIIID